jgi:hypothetical protein
VRGAAGAVTRGNNGPFSCLSAACAISPPADVLRPVAEVVKADVGVDIVVRECLCCAASHLRVRVRMRPSA